MSEATLEQRLAALENEPDAWVRENARGVLLGEQCRRCLATIITGKPAPRKQVTCVRCLAETSPTDGAPADPPKVTHPKSLPKETQG